MQVLKLGVQRLRGMIYSPKFTHGIKSGSQSWNLGLQLPWGPPHLFLLSHQLQHWSSPLVWEMRHIYMWTYQLDSLKDVCEPPLSLDTWALDLGPVTSFWNEHLKEPLWGSDDMWRDLQVNFSGHWGLNHDRYPLVSFVGCLWRTSKAPAVVSGGTSKTQDPGHQSFPSAGYGPCWSNGSGFPLAYWKQGTSKKHKTEIFICVCNSSLYGGSSNRISLVGPEKLREIRNSINTL